MSANLSIVACDQDTARAAWQAAAEGSIDTLSVRFAIGISSEADLTIQRILTDATGAIFASETILVRRTDGPEHAQILLDAIQQVSQHVVVVGRATMLAGPNWLCAKMDAIVRRLKAERSASIEKQRAACEAAERLHRHVDVFFRGKRETILDLQRGDAREPAWTIAFSERWERDRFWDWLRWQRHRFADFVDVAAADGALALRGFLLREMLETERAAKTAGLATSGRRPLRFWCGTLA